MAMYFRYFVSARLPKEMPPVDFDVYVHVVAWIWGEKWFSKL
jgi:hypothetical protein